MSEFIVETDQGKVKVNITLPVGSGPKERNDLVDQELAANRFTMVPPSLMDTTGDALAKVGNLAKDVGPSMLAIGRGGAAGAELGAPFGPVAMVGGALGGAALGGILGRQGTNVLNTLMGQPSQESPLTTIGEGAKTGIITEALGFPFRLFPGQTPGFALPGQIPAQLPVSFPPLVSDPEPLRTLGVNAARAHGINLSAAEQSGNPFLRIWEALTSRSLMGANTFTSTGEQQTQKIFQAGGKVSSEFGPMLDVETRANRFLTSLQGQIKNLKDQGSQLFEQLVRTAGPESRVDISALVETAGKIAADRPLWPSLQKYKLNAILKDIHASTIPPDALAVAKQMGLNPDVPGELATLKQVMAGVGKAFDTGPITVSLSQARHIRTALGDIAYPDALQGTVTVDAPVAAARRLEGAMHEALQNHADLTGTRNLFDAANQYRSITIGNLDSNFYASLLSSNKNLASWSKQLFNNRDPGMLLDAHTVVSDSGWKLIQQQWWDDVFNAAKTHSKTTGAAGFDGVKFAERVQAQSNIIPILFNPKSADAITGLAQATRLASKTSKLTENDLMGILVGGGQLMTAMTGAVNIVTGDVVKGAAEIATAAAPYFMAKAFTNPTTAGMLASMMKTGKIVPESLQWMVGYLTQASVVKLRSPVPGLPAPAPAGPPPEFPTSPAEPAPTSGVMRP